MRYIVRKFIDASSVQDALNREPITPIHDVYLKEGEEPKKDSAKDLIGFHIDGDPDWRKDEIR